MTVSLADRLRVSQTMQALFDLPLNDELKTLLLNAQREELSQPEPSQELIRLLSLISSGTDEDRAQGKEVIARYNEALTTASREAAVTTDPAPLKQPLLSSRPDNIAAAELLAKHPELSEPGAELTEEMKTQLMESINSIMAASAKRQQAAAVPVLPQGTLVGYVGKDTFAGQDLTNKPTDADGGGLPEEHYTIIEHMKAIDPTQAIKAVKGLVFSVRDCDAYVHGLSFTCYMIEPVAFDDQRRASINIALRLPHAHVAFDDHEAPKLRHAGAFIEAFNLMREGYIFLINCTIVEVSPGSFALAMNPQVKLTREGANGEGANEVKVFDASTLTALDFVSRSLKLGGFLGVTVS